MRKEEEEKRDVEIIIVTGMVIMVACILYAVIF